jgi:hypothetical protein
MKGTKRIPSTGKHITVIQIWSCLLSSPVFKIAVGGFRVGNLVLCSRKTLGRVLQPPHYMLQAVAAGQNVSSQIWMLEAEEVWADVFRCTLHLYPRNFYLVPEKVESVLTLTVCILT